MVRIALLLAVVAALASALARSSTAAPARLTATVGPGYTISLKKGSTVVRSLKRGKYLLTVRDRSSEHDFHLRGPCRPDDLVRRLDRHEDDHDHAEEGPLHLRLRPARRPDARRLPRYLSDTEAGPARCPRLTT